MDDLVQRLHEAACDAGDGDTANLLREAAAALEAAREDAERYRFIAADKSPAWDEEIDAAIDAAREARNG